MSLSGHDDVTRLLHAWTAGDLEARERVLVLVYGELRRRAAAQLRHERPGHTLQPTADDAPPVPVPALDVDVLDLDAALERLSALDQRKGRIAELRFFGGLSLEETGHVLHVSEKTVEREWQAARAWLFRELSARPAEGDQ